MDQRILVPSPCFLFPIPKYQTTCIKYSPHAKDWAKLVHVASHLNLIKKTPGDRTIIVTPTIQMRKLRPSEVK